MAGHCGPGSSTTEAVSHQIQSNVVKTMILVSACYAVTDLPLNVYYLMLNLYGELTLSESGWYASLFISCFYVSANPFIYATKFDPVNKILVRMLPCR